MAFNLFTAAMEETRKKRITRNSEDIKAEDEVKNEISEYKGSQILASARASEKYNNTRIPTLEEVYRKSESNRKSVYPSFESISGKARTRSAPESDMESLLIKSNLRKRPVEELMGRTAEIFGEDNRGLKSFFVGRRSKPVGSDDGFFDMMHQKGLMGLWETWFKTDEERTAEMYYQLAESGVDPEEAFVKALDVNKNGREVAALNEREYRQIRNYERWEVVNAALESLDVVLPLAGKAIKTGAMRGLQPVFKSVQAAGNAAEARRLLTEAIPSIKNSPEADVLVGIIRNTPTEFSVWKSRQVARNTKLFKEVAETNKKTAAKAVADTDVQRLLYDGSSPIITFGKESTQLNVAIRDEIRDILSSVNAGNGKRLSDLDILQSEVKAGSIPFDAKTSDTFKVSSLGRGGRSLHVGERVSLTKEAAEAGARTYQVKPDDLVQLPDGTYTYAPKRAIKEGRNFEPTIQALRGDKRRAAVESAEKARAERRKALTSVRGSFTQALKQAEAQKNNIDETIKAARDSAVKSTRKAQKESKAAAIRKAEEASEREILRQLEGAEAGVRNISFTEGKLVGEGKASTFPSWIPKKLQDEGVIDRVVRHWREGTTPKKGAKQEKELLKLTKQRVDQFSKQIQEEASKVIDNLPEGRTGDATGLASEAKKYKSAEEFIEAQGTTVYHGTGEGVSFDKFDTSLAQKGNRGKEVYLTENKVAADWFSKLKSQENFLKTDEFRSGDVSKGVGDFTPNTKEFVVPKDAKIKVLDTLPQRDADTVIAQLKKEGYDGVRFTDDVLDTIEGQPELAEAFVNGKSPKTTIIFNPNILKTKSQLTDIWNKANKPALSEAKKFDKALDVDEDVEISVLEKRLQDQYKKAEEVEKEFGDLIMELDLAKAGDIILDGEGKVISSWKSTFPGWISEGVRTRGYVDKVLSLIDDPANIRYPDNPIANRQRQAVDDLLTELDSRLGIDTSETRAKILSKYGEKPKQTEEQLKQSLRRNKGGDRAFQEGIDRWAEGAGVRRGDATGLASEAKKYKSAEASTREGLRATPKGEGKSKSRLIKTLNEVVNDSSYSKEADNVKKKIGESGDMAKYEKEFLEDLNVLTDKEAKKTFVDFVSKNSLEDAVKVVETGNAPKGSTSAHFAAYLMDYLTKTDNPELARRLTNAMRNTLSKEIRAFGQETSAIRLIYKDNPLMKSYILENKLKNEIGEKGLKEATDKLRDIISKSNPADEISDAIDENIC